MTMADAAAVIANFLASKTENVTIDDIETISLIIVLTLVENLNAADANTVLLTFCIIKENSNLADLSAVTAQFQASIIETFSLLDSQFPRGWFKINDDQAVTWAAINNDNSVSWTEVNNTQPNSWVVIDNNQ
jgi:hypothetical protein